MKKVLNRPLFRKKAQVATGEIPKAYLGMFVQGARMLAPQVGRLGQVVSPYVQRGLGAVRGAGQQALGAMRPVTRRIQQIPGFDRAMQASKRVARPLYKGTEAASLGYTGIQGLQAAEDIAGAGLDVVKGDLDQAASGLSSAGGNLFEGLYGVPFVGGGLKALGAGRLGVRARRRLGKTLAKNPIKTVAGLTGAELAGEAILGDPVEAATLVGNVDPSRSATAQGLSVPTETDEDIQTVSQVLDEPKDTQKQIAEDVQKNVEPTIGIDEDAKLSVQMENPKLYDEIISGQKGVVAKEDQVQADTEFADGNATGLVMSETNPKGNKGATSQEPYEELLDPQDLSFILSKEELDDSKSQEVLKRYEEKIKEKESKRQSFEDYKKRYQEMTGDTGNNYRDIALFKWAMRMMSGRTDQGGMAGFFDILGRSSNALADDILAIDQHEKAQSRQLANQYLEYEKALNDEINADEKVAFQTALELAVRSENYDVDSTKALQDRALKVYEARAAMADSLTKAQNKLYEKQFTSKSVNSYSIPDPSVFGGQKKMSVHFNAQGQAYVIRDVNGQQVPMMLPGSFNRDDFQEIKNNPTRKGKLMDRMSSASQAIKMSQSFAQAVQQYGDGIIGLSGLSSIILENVKDIATQLPFVGDKATEILRGDDIPGAVFGDLNNDEQFIEKISAQFVLEGDSEAQQKENQKNIDDFVKSYRNAMSKARDRDFVESVAKQNNIEKNDPQYESKIAALAQLLIIEERMKYLIAHANKKGDRLAKTDIQSAEKQTAIFSLTKSRQFTKDRYKAFISEMNDVHKQIYKEYIENGGRASLIQESYGNVPWVQQEQLRVQQFRGSQAPQSDREATNQRLDQLGL
jgi:hypothetical protein